MKQNRRVLRRRRLPRGGKRQRHGGDQPRARWTSHFSQTQPKTRNDQTAIPSHREATISMMFSLSVCFSDLMGVRSNPHVVLPRPQSSRLVRFSLPEKAGWHKTAATPTGLGQFFTHAVRSVAAACSSSATPETRVPGNAVVGAKKKRSRPTRQNPRHVPNDLQPLTSWPIRIACYITDRRVFSL